MILEKGLVLFVLVLYFPCSFCDDNASQEATNSIPHRKWNSGSMEKLRSNVYYASAEGSTSFANGSRFTDGLGTDVSYDPESAMSYASLAEDDSGFTKNPTSSTRVNSGSTENTASIVKDFGSIGNSASYNFGSTRDLASYASDDPRGSTRRPTSLAGAESGSTENPTSFTSNFGFAGSIGSGVSYNPESTEKSTSAYDSGSMRHPTSLASTDSGSTGNLTTNTSYKSTVAEEFTTRYESDSTLDNDTKKSSILDITQLSSTTVSDISVTDNTDNTTIDPTICDPTWPVNASGN